MKSLKKKEIDKLTLVKEILLQVYDTSKDIYGVFENPHDWESFPKRSKQTIYTTVNRLKNEGYLEEVEARGKKRYRATLKGKAKILSYIKKDKKWDGKWRIVVFDVPEKQKKMRNYFRKKLIEIGFRKLQESVWICPFNIADMVEELINLCEAEDYVHYLLVEELDNRDVLMKLFKLSQEKLNNI